MKYIFTILVLIFCFNTLKAQNFNPTNGGEHVFNENKIPCLTLSERERIKIKLQRNVELLKQQNRLAFSENNREQNQTLFIWPVKKADGFYYNDVWSISGYVDHNASFPNQLTDYNCGTRTYDTNSGYNHQGLDIYTWPFTWKMLDEDSVEIIAAANGQIIAKGDGQFDRSCNFNNNPWNAVYIQHSDGSIAWYGHMKNGSLTTKNVGDMVTQGEYLGVVGSSGNSTGPHLHFEIYEDNTYTQLIDPYQGTCNNLNSDSWWAVQKPYTNPNINAVLTHNAAPNFQTCPTTETPNESTNFETNQSIYFGIYMRDQQNGTSINLKLIKPDNTYLYNWNFNFTANYTSSWWYWNFNTLDVEGEWKWEATYQGQTVTHAFNVGTLSTEENTLSTTTIYPNPTENIATIKSKNKLISASIYDISGKNIKSVNFGSDYEYYEIDLSNISKGMYFISVLSDLNNTEIVKLIKK